MRPHRRIKLKKSKPLGKPEVLIFLKWIGDRGCFVPLSGRFWAFSLIMSGLAKRLAPSLPGKPVHLQWLPQSSSAICPSRWAYSLLSFKNKGSVPSKVPARSSSVSCPAVSRSRVKPRLAHTPLRVCAAGRPPPCCPGLRHPSERRSWGHREICARAQEKVRAHKALNGVVIAGADSVIQIFQGHTGDSFLTSPSPKR